MARVKWIGVTGRLSAGIDDNDTSISSAGLADLPAITAPDYAVLVLDPGATAGTPEVVYVTAHTASATTATISRGEETGEGGSVGRAHAAGIYWANAPTSADFTRHVADATELNALVGINGEMAWQEDTNELYVYVDGATPVWDLVYPSAGVEDWHYVGSGGGEPAFENSWDNLGFSQPELAFRKIGNVVYLSGSIWEGGGAYSTDVIFTLPSGYRPATTGQCPGVAADFSGNTIYAGVTVATNGEVAPSVNPGAGTWTVLSFTASGTWGFVLDPAT